MSWTESWFMEPVLSVTAMLWRTSGARTVPQAFPYQGSKRALAGQILSVFPDGGVSRLIEPCAGSAALSVASLYYNQAERVHISDVNGPLMDLWKLIISKPGYLIDQYTRLWNEQRDNSRDFYLETRDKFNATKSPELLLYLLCGCVKAAVRYSKSSDFNQGADHRRLGARPARMTERINAASRICRLPPSARARTKLC